MKLIKPVRSKLPHELALAFAIYRKACVRCEKAGLVYDKAWRTYHQTDWKSDDVLLVFNAARARSVNAGRVYENTRLRAEKARAVYRKALAGSTNKLAVLHRKECTHCKGDTPHE